MKTIHKVKIEDLKKFEKKGDEKFKLSERLLLMKSRYAKYKGIDYNDIVISYEF